MQSYTSCVSNNNLTPVFKVMPINLQQLLYSCCLKSKLILSHTNYLIMFGRKRTKLGYQFMRETFTWLQIIARVTQQTLQCILHKNSFQSFFSSKLHFATIIVNGWNLKCIKDFKRKVFCLNLTRFTLWCCPIRVD